jgi:hypothetical protein
VTGGAARAENRTDAFATLFHGADCDPGSRLAVLGPASHWDGTALGPTAGSVRFTAVP